MAAKPAKPETVCMEQTTEQPPVHRRLTRVRDGQIIAGVANGIAEYLDVDPWIIRAAFVIFTFAGGSGVIAYIIGLLAMPLETDPPGYTPVEHLFSRSNGRRRLPLILLIVFLFFAWHGFARHGGWFFLPSFWLAAVLVGAGLFMFRDRVGAHHDHSYNWQPTTAPPTSEEAAVPPPTITTPTYGQAPAYSRRRRHRERSSLGMLTFGAAIVATGIAIALTQSDAIHLKVQQVLAVPMVVLGIGLLVGTFIGRARSLIIPALFLVPFLAAASMANVPLHTTAGQRVYRPATSADVQTKYSLGAGRLIVDLSNANDAAGPSRVDINDGAGELVVVIPKGRQIHIDASEGAGVVNLLGHESNGVSPHQTQDIPGTGAELQLHIRNGFGHTFVTDDPNSREATR